MLAWKTSGKVSPWAFKSSTNLEVLMISCKAGAALVTTSTLNVKTLTYPFNFSRRGANPCQEVPWLMAEIPIILCILPFPPWYWTQYRGRTPPWLWPMKSACDAPIFRARKERK